MTDAHKKLLEAQKKEHEKTHAELRKMQKENANLRELLSDENKRYREAVKLLHQIVKHIQRDYPLEETTT
jgi:nitrate reductase assembly molybdenum cofactor insertion protein NarJ